MDELVLRAMAKWPNVPALYGWLGLDRRGQWRLQGERVEHEALAHFIGRNYAADEHGRWFFQNGPQRVYVALAYVPWVLRLRAVACLQTHTGRSVDRVASVLIDETGSLLLAFDDSVGLLLDRDLDWAVGYFRGRDGRTLDDEAISAALERLQAGEAADLAMMYQDRLLAVDPIRSGDVAQCFGFVREPAPE
jgi:hypothetical protein